MTHRQPDPPDDRPDDGVGLPPELDPRRGTERPARAERAERPARAERAERPARAERAERADRAERPARAERVEAAQAGSGSGWGSDGGGPGSPGLRLAARAAKILAAALSVVVLVTSGAMWGFYRDFTANVAHIDAIPPTKVPDVDGTDQNILLVGDDSRAGLTPTELKEVGTEAETSLDTDSMLLVHIPADGRKATVVSLPRDSYVEIPGVGHGRLNSAYANGAVSKGYNGTHLTAAQKAAGAQKLIETVGELTGVHIDHYVEVGLIGFYRISNALGGVPVCLLHPAKDHYSGINLPAGHQTIRGSQALAFVRQRHGLPRGDLDRVRRQQVFLGAVADKVLSADTLLNPFKLKKLLGAVSSSLTIDQSLDLVKLAAQMRDLAAGNVTFTTMPTEGNETTSGGASVLGVSPTRVRAFFRTVMGSGVSAPAPSSGATSTVPRSQVAVAVQNGAGVSGLATRTQRSLSALGFRVVSAGNADRSDHTTSEIHYAAASAAQARTLAAVVPGARLVPDGSGSTLQLVLGSSFTGVRAVATASRPASSATHAAGSGSAAGSGTVDGQSTRTAADTSCVD